MLSHLLLLLMVSGLFVGMVRILVTSIVVCMWERLVSVEVDLPNVACVLLVVMAVWVLAGSL